MNEEQKKQYADGLAQQRFAAARMYGAMTVWKESSLVHPSIKAHMGELVAEYEEARKLIEAAMAPAVQTELTPQEKP